ncbi:type IV pilus assembly protein PilM [Psychromonas sp. RZ22]|uniref:type IV pilus assembly protein PilM n=1 Tax=Psychromonas algarum TaxID=2555643 RepID=UPI0010681271|nr:type IV pilus assembly protein PilM [Psychromonas sp. RZ22]TEW53922.1 type IV pilus assembly protein PilM [Psychromonas sp. RZ22]
MFSGFKKMGPSGVIGIDFGSDSIKAMAISKGHGTYQIDAVGEAPVTKGLIVDNRLEDVAKLTLVIKQLRKNFPANYRNAAIAVTGADVITKVMTMNADLDELELEAQVELEAESSIPFPLDEIFIDFEIIGPNAVDKAANDILVSAARKERVLSQVQCVDESGLKTTVVDVASHALARATELVFSPEDYDQGIALVDIGASQMMLNIFYQGNIIFTRSKNHGGATCTQMIADRYGFSFTEAEKMKLEGNLPVDCDIDVITPFINQTVNHLRFDLRMFTNAPNTVEVKKLILTGGGQLMPELVQQLKDELEVNVQVADPYLGFEFKNEEDKTLLSQSGAKYMMALGLALRGVI